MSTNIVLDLRFYNNNKKIKKCKKNIQTFVWIVHRWSGQCHILITVIGIYFVHDHVVFYEKKL